MVFRASFLEVGGVTLTILLLLFLVVKARRKNGKLVSQLEFFFKVSGVLLLGFLLLGPEVKKEYEDNRPPKLLVLVDESPSMGTQDIVASDGLISRGGAIESFLASPEWVQFNAETPYEIVKRSVSGTGERTNLSSALQSVTEVSASAVLLASDGAWNAGESPITVAQELRQAKIPVTTLVVGDTERLPDLSVRVDDVPSLVETEEPFVVTAEVASSFPSSIAARVSLQMGNQTVSEKTLMLEPHSLNMVKFNHALVGEGRADFTVLVHEVPEEASPHNNDSSFSISARHQTLKILLIDSLPRWEYRFIRNAMMRDTKVEVSCLLLHPELPPGTGPSYITEFPSESELAKFDVILVGDVGIAEKQLTEAQALLIRDAVKDRAAGLILMPGKKGWQQSLVNHEVFSQAYPVLFDRDLGGVGREYPSTFKLSSEGERSQLLAFSTEGAQNSRIWESLPGFQWSEHVSQVKIGAQTLAFHSHARNDQGMVPVIVTGQLGRGKVLYMGTDTSWKWRRGVEDLYHYRFWKQVARWMAYQRKLTDGEQAKLFLSTEEPIVQSEVAFHLQAMTKGGKPVTASQIQLVLQSPNRSEKLVQLVSEREWGEFKGALTFDTVGEHSLSAIVEGEEVSSRAFYVRSLEEEAVGDVIDFTSLDEVSRITEGEAYLFSERFQLLERLRSDSERPAEIAFIPLNTRWPWYATLVGAFSLSWVLRRLAA